MLCDKCGEAKATVHQITISNNEITHHHLCEECAKEMDVSPQGNSGENSVSSLLSSMYDEFEKSEECVTCGTTFAEFQQKGRVGCENCYSAFANQLEPLVKRIHGSDQHVGSSAQGGELQKMSGERKLQILQKDLERAVKKENYEKAAELRDRIEKLEEAEAN
ncbi:MAG: UvrB/UvrC motif-containing protein [bacterium]